MSKENNELESQLKDARSSLEVANKRNANASAKRIPHLIWAAVGGMALAIVGGQWFPGYQLDSAAERASEVAATEATNQVMAHLCAERFSQRNGLTERLAKLESQSSEYEQVTFLREGSWGVDLNGRAVVNTVATHCLKLIYTATDKG